MWPIERNVLIFNGFFNEYCNVLLHLYLEQRPSDPALSEHKNEKAIFKIPEYRACGRKRKLHCTKNKLPHRILAESNNASGDTRNIESTIIVSTYSDSRVTRQLESVDHVIKASCESPHGTIESVSSKEYTTQLML